MSALRFRKEIADWLAVTDAGNWPDRAGAGMIVSVDSAVRFQGHATLRIDIPAGSSGTYRVGTSAATVGLPSAVNQWDGQLWLYGAIRSSNLAAVDNYSIFFGDAAFANFYTANFDAGNYPDLLYRNGDWMMPPSPVAFGVGAGAPTFTGLKRLRVNFSVAADANPTTVWIGAVGFLPFQRPKVMIQLDDGYDEHYTFAAAEASANKIPISLSISSELVDAPGYMTTAQLVDLGTNPYVLLTNHAANNDGYNAIGRDRYLAQVMSCAKFLRSIGASRGALHHVYVQSQWDRDLADALRGAGILTARAGISTGTRNWQDMTLPGLGDHRAMCYTLAEDMETGTTLANVQTQILNAIAARQTCAVVGHRLDVSAGVDQWASADFTALMQWCAGLSRAGLADFLTVADWYQTLTGPLRNI